MTTERRPLTTAIHAIPNADPAAVRQFVTQEITGAVPLSERQTRADDFQSLGSVRVHTTSLSDQRQRTRRSIAAPVGLIPVTVRLRPELAGALKRASLERQLAGEEDYTQQSLVEQLLEPWLKNQGYLA